jgi:hypothetical protein
MLLGYLAGTGDRASLFWALVFFGIALYLTISADRVEARQQQSMTCDVIIAGQRTT